MLVSISIVVLFVCCTTPAAVAFVLFNDRSLDKHIDYQVIGICFCQILTLHLLCTLKALGIIFRHFWHSKMKSNFCPNTSCLKSKSEKKNRILGSRILTFFRTKLRKILKILKKLIQKTYPENSLKYTPKTGSWRQNPFFQLCSFQVFQAVANNLELLNFALNFYVFCLCRYLRCPFKIRTLS